jgi:hypothetical protein
VLPHARAFQTFLFVAAQQDAAFALLAIGRRVLLLLFSLHLRVSIPGLFSPANDTSLCRTLAGHNYVNKNKGVSCSCVDGAEW